MSDKKTLGRKTKIRHFHIQQRILKERAIKTRNDGNPAFTYTGYLFPELRKYYEAQEYKVQTYDYPEILIKNGGMPLNIFFPNNDISLSDEEIKESEEKDNLPF